MLIDNKKIVSTLVWLSIFLPVVLFAWGFYQVQFAGDILYYGAEPGKAIVHQMGQWGAGFSNCCDSCYTLQVYVSCQSCTG